MGLKMIAFNAWGIGSAIIIPILASGIISLCRSFKKEKKAKGR